MLKKLRILAIFLFLIVAVTPLQATADIYNVTAEVPFPTPSSPSIVSNDFVGATVTEVSQTITGTCQTISPYSVVSIWRQGVSIGSGLCSPAGFFSIPVLLLQGANVLTARTSNISSLYGPDGNVFALYYSPKTQPVPTPLPTIAPLKVDQPSVPVSQVSLTAPLPLVQTTEGNKVEIRVEVSGGTAPYVLILNWGDGTEETKKLDQKGSYVFVHTYLEIKNFSIKALLRDVLGESSQLIVPVVQLSSSNSTLVPASAPRTSTKQEACKLEKYSIIWAIAIGVIAFCIGRKRGIRIEQRKGNKNEKKK